MPVRAAVALVAAFTLGLGMGWAVGGRSDTSLASTTAPVTREPEQRSLFFLPFFGGTASERAKAAARLVAKSIRTEDPGLCARASSEFAELEQIDNFAGDYSPLRWTCDYLVADDETRKAMEAETREARRFVSYFGPDFSRIAGFVDSKHGDRPVRNNGQFTFLDELIRFNAPRREQWENTEAFMDWLDVGEGEVVADIGAGAGFYTWRFADRVGPTGTVHALELNPQHLEYMRDIVRDEKIANVKVAESEPTATGLPESSVDVAFLCLIYQALYGTVSPAERTAFVEDVRKVLKPGGRLVVVESPTPDEVPEGVPAFGGFSISRELVIPQLEAYGFRLVKETSFVPQRYALVFEKVP
jgi:predicted methyltransferase